MMERTRYNPLDPSRVVLRNLALGGGLAVLAACEGQRSDAVEPSPLLAEDAGPATLRSGEETTVDVPTAAIPLAADDAIDLSGEEFIAKAGPEHAPLWFFLGDWEGTEEYPASPYIRDGGTGVGRFSFRVMHDIWLSMDYNTKVTSKAGKVYEYGYEGVFYYHRYSKVYQQWLFHHLGEGEYAEGAWKNDHFFFESDDPMIGLPHGSRYTYTVLSEDEFRLQVDETFDNVNWERDMVGTYRRIRDLRDTAAEVDTGVEERAP